MLFDYALPSIWCWVTAAQCSVLPCARSSHKHPLHKFQARTQQWEGMLNGLCPSNGYSCRCELLISDVGR